MSPSPCPRRPGGCTPATGPGSPRGRGREGWPRYRRPPTNLAEYVNALAEAGKAPTTIERALAAISTAHRAAGRDRPDLTLARAVLRAHRRERVLAGTARARKAAPVTIAALRAMVPPALVCSCD